uniref:Uncharacterized protein n=1 Tax=Stegastes partitus TaxID=144197 RepID=A0A3B4Z689_9TELE
SLIDYLIRLKKRVTATICKRSSRCCVHGRASRSSQQQQKIHSVVKEHLKSPQVCSENVLWTKEAEVELFREKKRNTRQ